MRHLIFLTVILIYLSCNSVGNEKKKIQLPQTSTIREVKLSDSLGLISLSIPNRYDTFFCFGYNPGCGLGIVKQMYKFQPKNFAEFKESGMIDITEPEIRDQLIISHNGYDASDTTNDSTIVYNYHKRRRDDIMMSPYHGIVEKDFVEKTANGFQSIFVMNLVDTARYFFHKEIIASILKKKNIIEFDYLYVSNKKDSIADEFIKNALESVKTIKTNKSY